ncbi:NYN domain-containing protein [Candidatus Microgenomates bacterium]|nr:NYN domain-containing protein [Candidatus Microgenomates bacterium]
MIKRRKIVNYTFIDSQNLNLGIRAQGWRLDWSRFKRYLQSQWHVTKAYLFIGYIEEQEKMYKDLRAMGYTLVFKPTVTHGEEVKGNVDVELVLQVMSDWNKYHQAVVISGDGDFYSLVKHLIERNKLAALIVPHRRRYSSLYNDLPEEYVHFMDKLRHQLSYKPAKQG